MRMFSVDNPKAVKAKGYGYLNAIHYMAPHTLSGVNLCPHASAGCIALCLGEHSGKAVMFSSVLKSRIAKAQWFMKDRKAYIAELRKAIRAAQRKAKREDLGLCVRLNGATDIAWERSGLMQEFPGVQFVDYTKNVKRALAPRPANYHLTFSRSESNEADCLRVLEAGGTVAVVFSGLRPQTYLGFPVVDGDAHDLRHLDPAGSIIALSPKGRPAKSDRSGFVVRP